MDLTPRCRRALSTALAILLAIESVTVVATAAHTSVTPRGPHPLPEGAPAGLVLAESSERQPGAADVAPPVIAEPKTDPVADPGIGTTPAAEVDATPDPGVDATPAPDGPEASAKPARASMPERSAKASKTTPASSGSVSRSSGSSGSSGSRKYAGRNHVWIPGLGIDRSVSSFPCARTREPDNLVYRWGCAGANNVYLMGHAHSVFNPLHDAYTAGRLRVGMRAWYADSKGLVHEYAVKWWKVTLPTNAGWAWAAQAGPSMTLQTCVGANSKYRLVVRLVEVNG